MGIVPDQWGPYVWGAIHLICLGAPEKLDTLQQQAYRTFFEQLPYVLPCATCAQHLLQNLEKVPIQNSLSGREELFAWSVKLHNVVNEMLKKPVLSQEEARAYWDGICRGNKQPNIRGCDDKGEISSFVKQNTSNPLYSFILYLILLVIGIIIGYFIASSGSSSSSGSRTLRKR